MALDVVVRGKWKTVELEPSLFLQKDFDHLICIEELTDYTVMSKKTTQVVCISLILYYRPYLAIHRAQLSCSSFSVYVPVTGTFVLTYFRSQERISLPGTFVPWNFRSRERK